MAVDPNNPTLAYFLLFSCIMAWGSYAPLRRTSRAVDGPAFGGLALCAEFIYGLEYDFRLLLVQSATPTPTQQQQQQSMFDV